MKRNKSLNQNQKNNYKDHIEDNNENCKIKEHKKKRNVEKIIAKPSLMHASNLTPVAETTEKFKQTDNQKQNPSLLFKIFDKSKKIKYNQTKLS